MNFIKNLSVYSFTSLMSNSIPFLLLPILTRYLSPSDYGQLAAITAYIAVISPLVLFGIPSLIQSDFVLKDLEARRRTSSIWLGIPFFLSCSLTFIFWNFRQIFSGLLNIPEIWVPIIPVLALLTFIPQWLSVIFRMSDEVKNFALYEISQTVLQFSLATTFIIVFKYGWEGRIIALFVTGLLASIVGLKFLAPQIMMIRLKKEDLLDTLKFGVGLLPHSMLNQLIRVVDRIIILNFVGLAATGIYAVGWQVASIMLVICSTFNQAWTPFLFRNLHAEGVENNRKIVKYSYYSIIFFAAMFIFVNIISEILFSSVISQEYQKAKLYVPMITLGFLFTGIYLIFTDYIFYGKKTYLLSLITTVNLILNVFLSFLLVPQLGEMGVAVSFASSSAFVMIVTIITVQRLYPMPWSFWNWPQL